MSKIQGFYVVALNSQWYEENLIFSFENKKDLIYLSPCPKSGPQPHLDLKYSHGIKAN